MKKLFFLCSLMIAQSTLAEVDTYWGFNRRQLRRDAQREEEVRVQQSGGYIEVTGDSKFNLSREYRSCEQYDSWRCFCRQRALDKEYESQESGALTKARRKAFDAAEKKCKKPEEFVLGNGEHHTRARDSREETSYSVGACELQDNEKTVECQWLLKGTCQIW